MNRVLRRLVLRPAAFFFRLLHLASGGHKNNRQVVLTIMVALPTSAGFA